MRHCFVNCVSPRRADLEDESLQGPHHPTFKVVGSKISHNLLEELGLKGEQSWWFSDFPRLQWSLENQIPNRLGADARSSAGAW